MRSRREEGEERRRRARGGDTSEKRPKRVSGQTCPHFCPGNPLKTPDEVTSEKEKTYPFPGNIKKSMFL